MTTDLITAKPCEKCNGTGTFIGWDDCGREIEETCSCQKEK